jgi:hypothetical protein
MDAKMKHSPSTATTLDGMSINTTDRLAYSINGLAEATSLSRASIYEDAKAGKLKLTHKCGRTIVLIEDAQAWLRSGDDAGNRVTS